MAQIYLSGPAIASLRASARMTENKLMRAGRYGPVLRHDHVAFVSGRGHRAAGCEPITPERLALAAAGKPNRMLVAAPQEDRDISETAGTTLREVTQDLADKNARLADLRCQRRTALVERSETRPTSTQIPSRDS
jgi:hypothetical protein